MKISNKFFAEYQAISGSWKGRDDNTKNSRSFGDSGKSTITRSYAKESGASIIW